MKQASGIKTGDMGLYGLKKQLQSGGLIQMSMQSKGSELDSKNLTICLPLQLLNCQQNNFVKQSVYSYENHMGQIDAKVVHSGLL